MSISKGDFEAKYSVVLSELEWKSLITKVSISWEDSLDEFRLLAFRHIKEAMFDIGYKPSLEGKNLNFSKTE